MKKVIYILIFVLFANLSVLAEPEFNLDVKSAILMEADTGTVLYEQNPDEKLPIASVTKIMTMLLITEALDGGKITLEDKVSVSERAMSMGGSTMFLETGDLITVDEMLKGIAVASANDGCVAMAEFISGSESEFVRQMNVRTKELGMENTQFINTNGLDADGHYSSARDVAKMSCELLKHEVIFNYTTIWTDTMRDGKFGLANTNKLIRFYNGANGLKTGSTSVAKCCLSATAKRDNMQLIAVVLGAPTSAVRFDSAKVLLDYGFSAYAVELAINADDELERVTVNRGVKDDVEVKYDKSVTRLLKKGEEKEASIYKTYKENICCPIYKGDVLGTAAVYENDLEIGSCNIVAAEDVPKKNVYDTFFDLFSVVLSK